MSQNNVYILECMMWSYHQIMPV